MSSADRTRVVKRRSVLGMVAASLSAGCVGAWPQPTGPRGPPEAPEGQPREQSPLRIESWDFGEADSGLLRVFGTVQNDRDASAEATVEVRVRAGEQRYERTTTVDVPAGATAEFEIEFDVEYDTFVGDGSIRLDLI
jgi:hypothetical protein